MDYTGKAIKETLKANVLLNGKTIASNIDVTGGKLSYDYTFKPGTNSSNKITINIQESNKYASKSANTTLKISKDYQFINIQETTITTNTGSRIIITGNVTDKYKKLLTNTKLNIKIGNTYIKHNKYWWNIHLWIYTNSAQRNLWCYTNSTGKWQLPL